MMAENLLNQFNYYEVKTMDKNFEFIWTLVLCYKNYIK